MASLLLTLTVEDRASDVIRVAASIIRTVDGQRVPPFPERLALVGQTVIGPGGATVEILPSPDLLRWLADVIQYQRVDAR